MGRNSEILEVSVVNVNGSIKCTGYDVGVSMFILRDC
jgi:hypothetical protein